MTTLNRDQADRWCERGILALVLAILVYGPLATGAVRTVDFLVLLGLTLGVMTLWAVRLWADPRPRLLWPPVCWAVAAFVAYAIYCHATADIEYLARQELVRVLMYAFLFWAIINNLHRQESMQIISFTMIFLAMAISAYAVFQFFTGANHIWGFIQPYAHRGSGTYISPNHLGGFLEMLLPLGLAYALAGRLKALPRVFVGYGALVILAGILVTISRGSWIATAATLLLFFGVLLFQRAYRLPALILLAGLLVAGLYLVPGNYAFKARLRHLLTTEANFKRDFRLNVWHSTIQMWREKPWTGVGPAHFDARYGGFRSEDIQVAPNYAHNDYLNTLAEWGVIGTGLIAAFLGLLGAGTLRTWKSIRTSGADLGPNKGSNKFAFVLGAVLGLAALLAHSIFDFNMHIPANAIVAVALMAMLSSHLRFATERYWFGVRPWLGVILTLVLAGAGGYLGVEGWRSLQERRWIARAEAAPNFSLEQIADLKRAFAIEPKNPRTAYDLGEAFRRRSQEGGQFYADAAGTDYRKLAEEAGRWFEQSIRLDPWSARSYCGLGWCQDWLEQSAEAGRSFARAEELDPNSYFVLNNLGLHYCELGDYAAARAVFERSLRLEWEENRVAVNYLKIADLRLREAATNQTSAPALAR